MQGLFVSTCFCWLDSFFTPPFSLSLVSRYVRQIFGAGGGAWETDRQREA